MEISLFELNYVKKNPELFHNIPIFWVVPVKTALEYDKLTDIRKNETFMQADILDPDYHLDLTISFFFFRWIFWQWLVWC